MYAFLLSVLVFFSSLEEPRKLISFTSNHSFEETEKRLLMNLKEANLKVFTTIPHHEGAASVELELNRATVIVFGNPKVGTSLMQENMEAAIDLPLKFLLFELADGTVVLSFFDVSFFETEYGINQPEKLAKMGANLEKIALATTQD